MKIILNDGPYTGQCYALCPRHKGISGYLKQFPGCLWVPECSSDGVSCWRVPDEIVTPLLVAADGWDIDVADHRSMRTFDAGLLGTLAGVHPWQADAITHVLTLGNALINFDTGLGKSRVAIECAKVSLPAIVVCPASVRANWERECQQWAPGVTAAVLWGGGDVSPAMLGAQITVVSYEWLRDHGTALPPRSFNTLVYDELHYVKNGKKSKGEKRSRAEACVALSECNPRAIKLGLTATPVANRIEDLHNQLHVLSPGRFSSWMRFVKDYCVSHEGEWGGLVIEGLNPTRSEELHWRLDQIMIRKTKAAVAALLPPMLVSIDWHRGAGDAGTTDVSRAALETHTAAASPTKSRLTVESVMDMVTTHDGAAPLRIAVVTHLQATTHDIAAALKTQLRARGLDDEGIVTAVTGEVPTRKRDTMLRDACARDVSVLVATMHSIGVGVDALKVFKDVILAELYWSPMVVIQTLGRFCRLASPEGPVTVRMLALRGTIDEAIALSLETKITAALSVGGVGRDGELLRDGFNADADDDAFLALIREQAASISGTDEYGVLS